MRFRSEARFLVVGRGIPEDLLRLSGVNGVTMAPNVAEVAPFYDQAQVVVAPMRYCVGSAIKILETLAHQRPLICFAASGGRHALQIGSALSRSGPWYPRRPVASFGGEWRDDGAQRCRGRTLL